MKHFIVKSPFMALDTQGLPDVKLNQNQVLAGLRLAVKDLFHIKGLPTSAGNPDWLASHDIPTQTASSVAALMAAGAQLCGKTITDELAYSLNGQNIHYGTPENPITPTRLPGGSSSGSAVAVTSNLADIGLGTDTGGSIRVPASYNGLFGLRPTHGAVAADNMVALAPSFDTVGCLTRSLSTLEKAMAVLLPESDSKKSATAFTQVLVANNLIEQVDHKNEINAVLQQWRKAGCLSNEAPLMIDVEHWQTSETFRTLQGAEIWLEHGEWFSDKKPSMAPDIQSRFELSATITNEQVNPCQLKREAFSAWLQNELADSVLIIPTTPGLAPQFSATEESLANYRNQLMNLTAIAGLSGLPQLHLPACQLNIDGELAPCGVSLIGSKGSDLALIAFAKNLLGSDTNE